MNKKITALTLAAGLLAVPLSAKVSFSLDIEALTKADGTSPLANTGLLVLVVDAGGDGFSMPSAGSFVGGNDEVVTTWDLSDAQYEIAQGETAMNLVTPGGVTYESGWDGDNLALFWYPSLAAGETPSVDSAFGVFADANGLTSGDEWKMPGDGTLMHSLKLFTAAAEKFVMFGDVPNAIGRAAYAVNDASFPGATAPTDLSLTNVGATVKIDWTGGSAQGGGFIVQRRKSGSSIWESVGIVDNGTNTFTDSTVTPGGQYDYQLVAINGFQSAQTLPEFIAALRSRISNLSTRAVLKTGVLAPIMGIAVGGAEPLEVIMNAVGPSIQDENLVVASDTLLRLKQGINPNPGSPNPTLYENDDWESNADFTAQQIMDAINLVGGQELVSGRKDASAILEIAPIVGGYTIPVQNPSGGEGVCSLQVYDLSFVNDANFDGRLTSLSTRGFVGTGPDRLIGSFAIDGPVPMTVIIRANGPALRDFSDTDALTSENVLDNPTLILREVGVPEILASNDDWENLLDEGLTLEEIWDIEDRSGLLSFKADSKDSLIITTLEPGLYSAIVGGVDAETGVTLLEIYEVPEI